MTYEEARDLIAEHLDYGGSLDSHALAVAISASGVALESRVLADIESVKQEYYKQGFNSGREVGLEESRVLAQREPIYQVRPVGQLKWSDIEPVSLSMYQDAERYQTRIVFTHPTPDDASVIDSGLFQRLLHARSELGRTIADPMWADLAEVPKAMLKRWHSSIDAAIDAAMQADKEAK